MTENINKNPKSSLIREGLKKIFSSAGKKISYGNLQNIGLGYIKDVSEARKCALQEARELAMEFGYKDDANNSQFVKENDFSKLDAQNPEHAMAKKSSAEVGHGEDDMSNPEEAREIQIARELKTLASKRTMMAGGGWDTVSILADELLQMHGAK